MPFGLTNTPATFQQYINEVMQGLHDICVLVYLDDILIFSKDLDMHKQQVAEVLDHLHCYNLYTKLSKCQFHTHKVKYLRFIIGQHGITINLSHIETIKTWPELKSYHDIQVFLGLTNYF